MEALLSGRRIPAGLSSLADAFLQRYLQAHRLLVLLQEVLESFVGEFLKAPGAPSHNGVHCLPCIVIELDALTGQGTPEALTRCASGTNAPPIRCNPGNLRGGTIMAHSAMGGDGGAGLLAGAFTAALLVFGIVFLSINLI